MRNLLLTLFTFVLLLFFNGCGGSDGKSDLNTLLSGKKFYVVSIESEDGETDVYQSEIVFNKNMTKFNWKDYEDNSEGVTDIRVDGNVFYLIDEGRIDEKVELVKETNDYIEFKYQSGYARFYYERLAADQFYQSRITTGGSGQINGG
jgi:hypothetical protein